MSHEQSQHEDDHIGSEKDGGTFSDALSVNTSDSVIESTVEHKSDWKIPPDKTVSVETTQVSEPSPFYAVGVRQVDRESDGSRDGGQPGDETRRSHADTGQSSSDQSGTGDDRGNARGTGASDQSHAKGRPRSQPSMIKSLLMTAAMAAVCGLAGAVGYSYFFGSSDKNASEQKQTKGQSGSKQQQPSLAASPRPSHE